MAKLKYKPKNSTPSQKSKIKSKNVTPKKQFNEQNPTSQDTSSSNNGPSLREDNERLRGENKALRSRLLQSVASELSVGKSTRGSQNTHNDDDETTFMMLQEYITENENLRTRNSELVSMNTNADQSLQTLRVQNKDLLVRVSQLEQQMEQVMIVPLSESSSRTDYQPFSFSPTFKSTADSETERPISGLSSILSRPSAVTSIETKGSVESKKKNALQKINQFKRPARVSPRRNHQGSHQGDAVVASIKQQEVGRIPVKSPRTINIMKPKPKLQTDAPQSYLTMSQQKRGTKPLNHYQTPIASTTSLTKSESKASDSGGGTISVLKSKPTPPHKRQLPPSSYNAQLLSQRSSNKTSYQAPQQSNSTEGQWDLKLQSLTKMNYNVRKEIRSLENQINSEKYF